MDAELQPLCVMRFFLVLLNMVRGIRPGRETVWAVTCPFSGRSTLVHISNRRAGASKPASALQVEDCFFLQDRKDCGSLCLELLVPKTKNRVAEPRDLSSARTSFQEADRD
jgi:hypothetical protein